MLAAACAVVPVGTAWSWEYFHLPASPGYSGVIVGDFDGDGRVEALVGGTIAKFGEGPGPAVLAVVGGETGPLRVRDALSLDMQLGENGLALVRGSKGRDRAVAAASFPDGSSGIAFFSGVPLRLERVLPAPPGYRVDKVHAVADVDGDGRLEIVAGLAAVPGLWATPAVLDSTTGAVRWLGDQIAARVAVVQLDEDPALELVVSGTPGLIIDGATYAMKGGWAGGFGEQLAAGRFGLEGKRGFASALPGAPAYVQVFSGTAPSPMFEIATGSPVRHLLTSPGNEGATGVVAAQTTYSLQVFDSATGLRIHEFTGGKEKSFAIGDIRGAGHPQLIWSAISDPDNCPEADGSQALGSGQRAHEFSVFSLDGSGCQRWRGRIGPHAPVVRGPLGGAGTDQVASFSHDNVLTVLDAATGAPLRYRNGILSMNSPNRMDSAHLILASRAVGTPSLVVAGNRNMPAALDPVTLQARWVADGSGWVSDLGSIDVNGDGNEDIVIAASKGQLIVLDGALGARLGESAQGAASFWPLLETFHDQQGHAHAVVTSEDRLHLDAYDLTTVTHKARVAVAVQPVTALWSWSGDAGCRIAVLDIGGSISIRDCDGFAELDTRQAPPGTSFLREADALGDALIIAAGEYLYKLESDGATTLVAPAFGKGLGAGNAGDIRPLSAGSRWDAVLGSDTGVTRRILAPDGLFADGFD